MRSSSRSGPWHKGMSDATLNALMALIFLGGIGCLVVATAIGRGASLLVTILAMSVFVIATLGGMAWMRAPGRTTNR